MLNILKADFYKAYRSTEFWVTSGLVVLISLFISFMSFWGFNMMLDQPETFEYAIDSILSMDFLSYVLSLLLSTVCLSGIFAVAFVVSEFTNGTIKNIASKGYRREYIYLSKFITTLCVSLINIALYFVTSFITAKLVIKDRIPDFYTKIPENFSRNISTILLKVVAYMSIAILIAILLRSPSASSAIFIGFIMIETTIIGVINKFIYQVFNIDFKIDPYTISGAFTDTSHLLRGTLIVVAYIIITTVIGIIIFKKRDIN